jgi:hypothetical protein
MTILKKALMAALASGVIGFAVPAGAQSSITVLDPDASGLTIVTKAPEGPVIVARDDGTKVVTERIVRKEWVVPTACNFIRHYNKPTNVAGGVGGSIGGRMILGSTSAEDVPLPGTCTPLPR